MTPKPTLSLEDLKREAEETIQNSPPSYQRITFSVVSVIKNRMAMLDLIERLTGMEEALKAIAYDAGSWDKIRNEHQWRYTNAAKHAIETWGTTDQPPRTLDKGD